MVRLYRLLPSKPKQIPIAVVRRGSESKGRTTLEIPTLNARVGQGNLEQTSVDQKQISTNRHAMGQSMDSQVEAVARAFYAVEREGQSWDYEFDVIKDTFRSLAHEALQLLDEHQGHRSAEANAFGEADWPAVA